MPLSYSLIVENTGQAGQNPVIYGDAIAYENDGSIYVYDISRKENKLISSGSNPALFGFIVAFETKESDADLNDDGDNADTVIQFADVRDGKTTSTKAVGRNPSVFSDFIIFSTKESELGIDFSNDADTEDDLIRQYDLETKEIINLKSVGDFPVFNQHSLVFITQESQINVDLNADGEKADQILRVYDRDKRNVDNTKFAGEQVAIGKLGNAVFVYNGQLALLDPKSLKIEQLGQSGNSPSLYNDVVIFEREGYLYGLSLENSKFAKTNILGVQPSLFENTVAFVSSEKDLGDLNSNGKSDELIIRYAFEEDADDDDISDFLDNCPAFSEVQNDGDDDGIGDACDTDKSKKSESKEDSKSSEILQNESSQIAPERQGIHWVWYLVVILLLPFAIYYGYKYYKKRKKSFGF